MLENTDYPVSVADIEAFTETLADNAYIGEYADIFGCWLYQTLAWKYGEEQVESVGGATYSMYLPDGDVVDNDIPQEVVQFLFDYRKCCGRPKAFYTRFRSQKGEGQ